MELYGYHNVLTTHNSRTSRRMQKYVGHRGPARVLSIREEIILTQIIGDIISENNYRCMAYNICNDHVHMIIVCAQEELTTIVRKLKSLSSKLFNRHEEVSKRNNRLT